MRKLIVAGIVLVLLLGGFIVYMEIDKRKFINSISSLPPVVDQAVNEAELTSEVTQKNEEPKMHEMSPDELITAVRRIPEQFGYVEAAKTYAELEEKKLSGERLTIDEKVARLEAMLYLYPNEYTQRALILERFVQSKGPNFHPRDGFSNEDIAELKDLGIPVVWRGNEMIINPPPDHILQEVNKELEKKNAQIFNDPRYFPDEDIDFPPARSEGTPIMPEPKPSVMSDHVHHEAGHVHEPTTIQPPAPTAAKGVEARGWEGLSLKQREEAKQLFDQYGVEEGLRRFREVDPDAAAQFERERRKPPVHSELGEESSAR